MRSIQISTILLGVISQVLLDAPTTSAVEFLPGTHPLKMSGEIDVKLIDGANRFLLREIEQSIEQRQRFWNRDRSDADAYNKSIEGNRLRLEKIIGIRDSRVPLNGLQLITTTDRPSLVAEGQTYEVHAVRWPVVGDLTAEGLLLRPKNRLPIANIVAIPGAEQLPEQIAGMVSGIAPESQYARKLAENGHQVVVPLLINRQRNQFEWNGRRPDITNREFLYRSAFELGRHLVGYETQKILACVDWFDKAAPETPIAVVGWGDGGMIGLYAAALDTRIDAVLVSGHFHSRQEIWDEPIDRNVFGLLREFGDAELGSMVAGRGLIVEAAIGPGIELSGGAGAPATLKTPRLADVRREFARARELVGNEELTNRFVLIESENGAGPFGSDAAVAELFRSLGREDSLSAVDPPRLTQPLASFDDRLYRQMHEIDRHNQWVLRESPFVRKQFLSKLDSTSLDAYEKSCVEYRKYFHDEVIGRIEQNVLPPNPRTRKAYDTEKWTGYEVVLDVYPELFAYGLLLLPKDLTPGERRPVIVCQHGLEGRPQDLIGDEGHAAYKAFAAKLAERGFITFAPQNLYRHRDKFRTLQRKANSVKKTLFSLITPQHQQIVDWLQEQPFVDPDRIGFYGLSYGGKTAMRVPALVTDYCFSICSADFNEWVDKNASTRNPRSYVWTGEYEIFEFDLGSTFNYAEMAALIAPRPFMVERGHFDGVADDETVGWEFAKVRNLYQGRLKIGDRCEIEWFDGPHTINGVGTFKFVHRHLNWPTPRGPN